MLRFSGRSKGQSAVVVTFALVSLMGVCSLAIDFANIYFNWFKLQEGTDASVLAGATYLPAYGQDAITTAQNYANTNGIQTSEIVSTTVSSDNLTLTMQVSRNVPYYFARVLGFTTARLNVTAAAQAQSVGGAQGVIPIGIDYGTPYTKGETIVIKYAQVGPGNWQPLSLGGNGGDVYRNNIINGYSGTVKIGDQDWTETGNLVGPTAQAVNQRLAAGQTNDPGGTFAYHALDDQRVFLVPMVDFSGVHGKSTPVPVKGFAELWVVGIDGNSGDITTYFIEQSASKATALQTADNFGAYVPALVE